MNNNTLKETIIDLENVLFHFYNGNTYESMRDLENIVSNLKTIKEEK